MAPFCYVLNSPLRYVDPDGREPHWYSTAPDAARGKVDMHGDGLPEPFKSDSAKRDQEDKDAKEKRQDTINRDLNCGDHECNENNYGDMVNAKPLNTEGELIKEHALERWHDEAHDNAPDTRSTAEKHPVLSTAITGVAGVLCPWCGVGFGIVFILF
jgi:hypothetical protein